MLLLILLTICLLPAGQCIKYTVCGLYRDMPLIKDKNYTIKVFPTVLNRNDYPSGQVQLFNHIKSRAISEGLKLEIWLETIYSDRTFCACADIMISTMNIKCQSTCEFSQTSLGWYFFQMPIIAKYFIDSYTLRFMSNNAKRIIILFRNITGGCFPGYTHNWAGLNNAVSIADPDYGPMAKYIKCP